MIFLANSSVPSISRGISKHFRMWENEDSKITSHSLVCGVIKYRHIDAQQKYNLKADGASLFGISFALYKTQH